MATIGKDKGGLRRILFVDTDGRRRTVRLGKTPQKTAEAVKIKVERLVSAKGAVQAPDPETARWVASLDDVLYSRLAAVGLVPERERARLGDFLDAYITSRADLKGSTATVLGHTRRCLVEYYGADRPLAAITPGDADAWRAWLVAEQKLADNTVRRRSGVAKQFFKAAVRRKLIVENPFSELTAVVRGNPSRFYFVTREEAAAVLNACPDAQWRLLFALARFGGLRCPSEHLGLRWADVDWARGRVTIHSPKTEHHPGGATRQIPIFPELRPYLEAVWEQAEPGTEHVITRYRDSTVNLRTQLQKIIRRAGLTPWPKLWQNLRSTRQTELAERFPAHVVCKWLGNSQPVAAQHYLQVTDDHFAQGAAAGEPLGPAVERPREAAQNPAQYPAGRHSKAREAEEENPVFTESYEGVRCLTPPIVGDTGLEPVTPSLSS